MDKESASSTPASDSQQRTSATSSSLLVRLLFLFVSSSWDEAHFRDGFWLPLFFDILLCDVDTSLPPLLATGSRLFPALNDSRDPTVFESTTGRSTSSELSKLVELQIKGSKEAAGITFKDGLRGLLCLVHRHPALATQLMTQLWPQLWNRLLLRQPDPGTDLGPYNPNGQLQGTTASDRPEHDSEDAFRAATAATLSENMPSAGLDNAAGTCSSGPIGNNNPTGHGSFSVNEIRSFALPQLWRFLTSDQHVNPAEPQPSALGAFLSCLATTPDTVLIHIPLPAVTYLGTAYNQWHSVALFLESLCSRARKLGSDTTGSPNDFVYNVSLPPPDSDANGSLVIAPVQPSEVPAGSANLSLISLYDAMSEPDYLTSAWWYRLTPVGRPHGTHRQAGMLKSLEYAQHGLLLRSLETSLDQLASTTMLGMSALGSSLESGGGNTTTTGGSTVGGGSASSNRAAAVAASTASAVARSQSASPLTLAGASAQFSEYVNRARLQDYCIRYLKQLGQWDSLETLASNLQTGSYMSSPFGAGSAGSCGTGGSGSASGPGSGSGSAYWGLKADAAWRRSDWTEVYASLSRLANEAPRTDLCRYALIQGAACVAGRRTTSGFAAAVAVAQASASSAISSSDSDPYGGSSVGEAGGGGAPGSNQTSTVSGTGAGSNPVVPASSGSPLSGSGSSAANAAVNSVVSIIQASELESHGIMSTVLREWRRMPLIITTQHVPLLQIAHRAVEVTEGNSLLAQYCGHVLSGPCLGQSMSGSSYTSPGQSSSSSSTPGTSTTGAGTSTASPAALRIPLSQALHDYKTVFKWWQSRPPSIGDDLGFWHDLFSWRQVVEESIITHYPCLQKFSPERANLMAVCERELALSQLQLARGARKYRFPSIAQQHLDRYTRMNLPPLFEKTKQEIKLKMAELRKDELLEGLELMEKTNIQQYEKKDRAKFFCYKAVFFSHFNKGDEATKNFGYATQMQDNIHKVWSIYGDFLENVYSSYPAAKREVAVSTTGFFAMQALMEAASVAGGQERRSRADIAKCLWLLTLDDTKGQQRLARTFEERASRVRSDAFLPWLPSLVASLLRPEGRFIVPALRGVTATHPTVLYSLLRGLQHQLSTEVLYDERLGELAQMAGSEPDESFAHALQSRICAARGSQTEDTERKQTRLGSGPGAELGRAGSGAVDPPGRASGFGSSDLSISGVSTGITGTGPSPGSVSLGAYPTVSPASSKKKKRVIVVMRGVEGERLSGGSPLSPDQQQQLQPQQVKKGARDQNDLHGEEDEARSNAPKKTVVVVASSVATGSGSTAVRDPLTSAGIRMEDEVDDTDDLDGVEEEEGDTEDGEFDRDEVTGTTVPGSGAAATGSPGSSVPTETITSTNSVMCDADSLGVGVADQGTGCLSCAVTDGLHRINLLMGQIRRRHAARIYAIDLFTAEVGGRLQPTWAEQLLTRLCSVLDYLQRLAWAGVSAGRHWHPRSVERVRVPDWLLLELRIQLTTACGLPVRTPSVSRSGWARLSEMVHGTLTTEPRKRVPDPGTSKRDSSSSSSSESDKEEPRKPVRSGRKQQFTSDSGKGKPESSATDTGSKLSREKHAAVATPSSTKRPVQTDPRRSLPRTNLRLTPAFTEVTQISAESARREADRDPWFMRIHRQLLKAVDDWENRPLLYVMQQLTRHWIPLLEQRVSRLPTRTHLSDYGARRLMELPNLVVTSNHISASPTSALGSGGSNASSSASPGASIVLPSVPCLELPGESGLLQSAGGFLSSAASPYPSGPSTAYVGPNLALHLVIAEVFPHVARVRSSPGRLGCPARRLGIRASNGRVFYYDLPALGYWPPISSSTSPALANAMSIQMDASAGARTHSLIQARARSTNIGPLTLDGLCPAPYTAWRHTGPLHLFQMINDMLAGQPETAKRRLALFTPRMMEVGPMGLYLTEASASAPAASVGIASAHPFPSANSVTARGLTALARPPPVIGPGGSGSFAGADLSTKSKTTEPIPPAWAASFSQWDQATADTGVNKVKMTLPSPPPGPLPSLVSTPNTSLPSNLSVGGSAAVAAEAIGRPCGLDAGCHPACSSLTGVLEQACTSWYQSRKDRKSSNEQAHSGTHSASPTEFHAGNRELVCLFYELLLSAMDTSQQPGKVTASFLYQVFSDLSQRIPPSALVKNTLISALGALSDTDCSIESASYTESSSEFPRGNLLRSWAANRMLDAESYWLFRHNLASHLALIGLMEQLFHLTPTHPACLIMDPRSGRAESRHVRFSLPASPACPSPGATEGTTSATHSNQTQSLTACFAAVMGLHSPKLVSTSADGSASGHNRSTSSSEILASSDETGKAPTPWVHQPSPVPFRLTPHIAGFICLPGAPANVGPFAISLTTAAQALAGAQRPTHVLTSLYRTLLRSDYILWHRGRQAAVHAFQLLLGGDVDADQRMITDSSDSDTDTETGACKRKTKLFNELGVRAVESTRVEKSGLAGFVPPQQQQQQQSICPQRQSSASKDCALLPELTNEQLIQLITLTLDGMNTNLKSMSDYSGTEPGTWSSIAAATNPSNLVQMDPAYLPWL